MWAPYRWRRAAAPPVRGPRPERARPGRAPPAGAPGLDLSLSRRLAESTGRSQPTAGFLVDALTRSLFEERQALAALAPTAPLLQWRLVRLGHDASWSPEAPTLHRPLSVPERI